jgi:hypothetical protein
MPHEHTAARAAAAASDVEWVVSRSLSFGSRCQDAVFEGSHECFPPSALGVVNIGRERLQG